MVCGHPVEEAETYLHGGVIHEGECPPRDQDLRQVFNCLEAWCSRHGVRNPFHYDDTRGVLERVCDILFRQTGGARKVRR